MLAPVRHAVDAHRDSGGDAPGLQGGLERRHVPRWVVLAARPVNDHRHIPRCHGGGVLVDGLDPPEYRDAAKDATVPEGVEKVASNIVPATTVTLAKKARQEYQPASEGGTGRVGRSAGASSPAAAADTPVAPTPAVTARCSSAAGPAADAATAATTTPVSSSPSPSTPSPGADADRGLTASSPSTPPAEPAPSSTPIDDGGSASEGAPPAPQ